MAMGNKMKTRQDKTLIGYSGTPLAKKLGLKEGFRIVLYNAPKHYFDLFTDLPRSFTLTAELEPRSVDFIHLFCQWSNELKDKVEDYKRALKIDGLLWVSWPKGTSTIVTDLKRDQIREYLLLRGLVDVKVAAIDSDWSGLKFVYRVVDRK
jgi:hypothetical protein